MKVFLSHSTRDKEFALKLSRGLGTEGFDPWLCEMDIASGSNWVQAIEDGLRASEIVLLLWSPEAAASAATGAEWMSAWDREISDRRLRLGVVMVKKHPLPELIRTKQYIDATSNDERAIGRVVQWLHERRAAGRALAGKEAPVFLPDYRPQNFVGRQEQLKKMSTELVEHEGRLLLNGEPGSGKSTLALVFAWEAQKDFDAVVFQLCGQRSVDVISGEMAEQLKGALGEGVTQLPPDKKLEACKDWLKQRRSLLVLDDVWLDDATGQKIAELRSLIPGPPVSVLFTSRWRNVPTIAPNQIVPVESFTEPEVEEFFTAYLGKETVENHRDALLEFARRAERLPIAVAVGAELLRSQFDPLDEAARGLALEKLQDQVHDVPGLFQHAIEAQGKDERKLLQAASVCSPDGFWLPLVADISGLSKETASKARDDLVLGRLMRVLDQDRRRFQLHALLREQARASVPDLSILQEAHAAALERLFKDWEARWRECSECLEEIIAATGFLLGSGEHHRASQVTYWGYACGERIGELEVALRILHKGEEFWNGKETREAKDALQRIYGNQALILQAWGRLEEAFALHKREEAICLELADKASLLACYGNQAFILQAWGQLQDAFALLLEIEKSASQLQDKDFLQRTYGNQAFILMDWGRLDEALALLKKQEAICLELGDNDALQTSYGNQALILQVWGRLDEAMALHKKQEAICVELGNKDSLQRSYGNQALILKAWGRLDEALALHKKEEAICLELGNKDGLQTTYGNQALILRDWGRLDEALALLRKKEAICLKLGNKSGLGYCYWSWGGLADEQGDRNAALKKLRDALAIFSELKMPRERDSVKQDLDKMESGGSPAASE